ncbi:MAG TPA: SpoIIE family protein phosphatase, partial [Bacteroidia bacterium]
METQTMQNETETISLNDEQKFFILFRPKDVVSGDFYWALEIHNKFYVCTADCTGHGVPGAMMSMLNMSYLNESIIEKGISKPDKVLNHIRDEVISALNPSGSDEESKDGMDCILACFDFTANMLEYAAANNGFYIIRGKEIITCPADKMPVGKSPKDKDPFTLHTVPLKQGDYVYMLTDGYPDQFGGDKGKKFKYKQLEELLLENCHKPMEEQRTILNKRFVEWKGNLE